MTFYSLSKQQRVQLVQQIHTDLLTNFMSKSTAHLLTYFNDRDTYIRKSAYLCTGKIYHQQEQLQSIIINQLELLLLNPSYYVRQTSINAAGEIGIRSFDTIVSFMDKGLLDEHHSVRNAVIGSIKKMGEKNPVPVLTWAKGYLTHPNKEIRREICHGIELRGRTHPQDILPLLEALQFDETSRVRNTLVHVIGQISYKKGCLKTVIEALKHWENQPLVKLALDEIIDVHYRYRNFSVLTQEEAKKIIEKEFYS